MNAANLPPGVYSGVVAFSSAAGQQTVPVSLSVASRGFVDGVADSVTLAGAAGSAVVSQTLNLTSNPGSLAITVAASTTSGGNWLSVSPASGATPAAITVTANLAGLPAGSYNGLISLQSSNATVGTVNIPVTLTVAPAPTPSIVSVTNGASFLSGTIAPGEVLTLFGSQLGPAQGSTSTLDSSGNLSTTLTGTRVLFDGVAAPLLYSGANQVSAIAPFSLAGRVSTAVQVEYNGVRSAALTFRVADAAPAIFTLDAGGQGAILNQDGSVNSAQNGAAAGSIVSIYATGAGQMTPAGMDGQITGGSTLPVPLLPVSIQIGGQYAQITYAGAAPGLPAGVVQVNAVVPAGVHGAQVPVVMAVGGQPGPAVNMAVR